MNTEANDKYNKGVREIVDNLYNLRRVEFSIGPMKTKYAVAQPLIKSTTKLLADKKNFVLFRPMWDELHDRMVYYYRFLNETNLSKKIPLFRETLHNELVKWWLLGKNKGLSSKTLLHFDTHDDMGLPDANQLLKPNNTLNESAIHRGGCNKIYFPVTCMLLSKGTDHVVWAMPKWIYDDNASFQQILARDKEGLLYIRPSGQKKDNFMMDGDVIVESKAEIEKKKYGFFQPFRFDRLHTENLSAWKKLSKIIENNEFILDIDLDYFACNGDRPSVSEYKRDFSDIESDGRVHDMPGITTPREIYSDDRSEKIAKDLNTEMELIRKRVNTFLEGLKILKDEDIIPSSISISDSTSSYFSGDPEKAVFTNEYTPKYFVPILHQMLIHGFHKLYGKFAFL